MNETVLRVGGWVVLYLVGAIIAELVAEWLFEFTDALSRDETLMPAALVWFVLLGLVGGIMTGGIAPDRMLPPGPFTGVSVLVLPLALAAGMSIVGWARGASSSHLATWYGGAAIGLGLAVGRLLGLAFVAEVRSV